MSVPIRSDPFCSIPNSYVPIRSDTLRPVPLEFGFDPFRFFVFSSDRAVPIRSDATRCVASHAICSEHFRPDLMCSNLFPFDPIPISFRLTTPPFVWLRHLLYHPITFRITPSTFALLRHLSFDYVTCHLTTSPFVWLTASPCVSLRDLAYPSVTVRITMPPFVSILGNDRTRNFLPNPNRTELPIFVCRTELLCIWFSPVMKWIELWGLVMTHDLWLIMSLQRK